MALVAYDNSDSSDFEDDGDENPTGVVTTLTNRMDVSEPSISKPIQNDVEEPSCSPNLFNFLPQPTNKKPAVIEEDDEFLHRKESINTLKPKAQITVPSLSDFKDVEDRPIAKPKRANGKKSGLLSMLPQPRNAVTISTKSLVPHVLTKKPTATAKKKEPLPSSLKKAKTESKTVYSDESDNDDEGETDFFSINKPVEAPIEDVPLDIDKPITKPIKANQKTPVDIQSYFKQDDMQSQMELQSDFAEPNTSTAEYYSSEASSSYSNGNAAAESSNDAVLDEEAILKLCGTRGKRKREAIQIVDVNQSEVLADAREWLLKGLMDDTSTRVSASKRRGDEPTSQQRRKHQITYLAHQAKANESELQNQWANNRMSRRQTQSKYGF